MVQELTRLNQLADGHLSHAVIFGIGLIVYVILAVRLHRKTKLLKSLGK